MFTSSCAGSFQIRCPSSESSASRQRQFASGNRAHSFGRPGASGRRPESANFFADSPFREFNCNHHSHVSRRRKTQLTYNIHKLTRGNSATQSGWKHAPRPAARFAEGRTIRANPWPFRPGAGPPPALEPSTRRIPPISGTIPSTRVPAQHPSAAKMRTAAANRPAFCNQG